MKSTEKRQRRLARARRTHAKARKSNRARLVVFKSNKTIYAQVVDADTDAVLCGTSGLKMAEKGMAAAVAVGKQIAEMAQTKKVESVVFDRNGYIYHGQVKALADAAREAGLKF
jgi:large subunit ribosomal protein L18